MIKKIDANKYGVVRYAISSIEDIADLPREVSVGSEAILVNEDGEKKFRLGSDGWVEVVEVKEYDEDKLRDILEDAKVGYGGIEYETLEERLDRDFDNAYSVLDNRTYIEYEGCRITAKDSLNGLQKETVVKGRTLQNLLSAMKPKDGLSFNNGVYETNPTIEPHTGFKTLGMIKGNTIYSLVIEFLEIPNGVSTISVFGDNEFGKNYYISSPKTNTRYVVTSTSKEVVTDFYFGYSPLSITKPIKFKAVLLEGDHRQKPLEELPFIGGIESVGDKSRNLFNGKLETGLISTEGVYSPYTRTLRTQMIEIKPNTQYRSSFDIKYVQGNTDTGASHSRFIFFDENRNYISHIINKNDFITPTNAKYLAWTIYSQFKTAVITQEAIAKTKFQLEEGSIQSPYQPYYDGYKISGKSYGKNLFNSKIHYDIYRMSMTFYKKDVGTYKLPNSISGSHKLIRVELPIGKTYEITINHFDKYYNAWTFGIFENDEGLFALDREMYISAYAISYTNTPLTTTFTTKHRYQFIKVGYSSNSNVDQDVLDSIQIIQIEEGEEIISYEPYKETTYSYILDEPLRSLPNGVCDEIDLEKGVVTRRVKEVVLNGTENWIIQSTNTNENGLVNFEFHLYELDDSFKRKENDNTMCDRFPIGGLIADEKNETYLFGEQTLYIRKFISSNITTVSDFKQWLQANPTTVYYQLANPTTEYLIKGDKFVTLPNGVKDEISHNSVLRRVGKVVLDGSSDENWEVWGAGINFMFTVPITNLKWKGGNPLLCDAFKCLPFAIIDEEGVFNGETGWMGFKISRTKLKSGSIDELREWLALNPITVWYELETPYTEPINPNEVILDTIRLKSYEPITHITSDNYLPPTIKTQVPSDFNAVVLGLKSNNEALASQVMSLRQTNDELKTTNREQDDVIDVTLLALDEVYGMIDEGEIETMSTGSPMVNVYVKMIKRGIKTLDEVPAKYRAEVEELI